MAIRIRIPIAKGEPAQVYLISPIGGEAFPVTEGEEEVHTFSWSADSQTIYFATRHPWSKKQKDDYKKEWKDVVQYRTAERGDTIFSLDLSAALARHAAAPTKTKERGRDADKEPDVTPGARAIATTPMRVDSLITSPDGRKLAFVSNAINQRQEKYEDVEIYTVNVARTALSESRRGPRPRPPKADPMPARKPNPAASPKMKPPKSTPTGPSIAATSSSPSKSETSPAPTATCNRTFTGSTAKPEQSNSGPRTFRVRSLVMLSFLGAMELS